MADRAAAKGESSGDGGAGAPISKTVRDHVRAVVGGLLVGLPLLWTQEMWRNGETQHPLKILVLTVDVLAGGSEVELLAGFSDKPEVDVAVRIVGLETP